MIKNADSPRLGGMAVFTFGAVMAVVVVIFEMAADAVHLHDIIKRVLAVTITAGKQRVFAFEWEFRVARMIETGVCPGTRVVAVITLFATSALVHIVLRVAAEACCWRVLMCLIGVAGQALDFTMFAD